VVSIVPEAPLHVNNLPGLVRREWLDAPAVAWLVVVDTIACVVAAGTGATNLGRVEIRPGRDWLKNSAFGTC
jgi:hypothetical protein